MVPALAEAFGRRICFLIFTRHIKDMDKVTRTHHVSRIITCLFPNPFFSYHSRLRLPVYFHSDHPATQTIGFARARTPIEDLSVTERW